MADPGGSGIPSKSSLTPEGEALHLFKELSQRVFASLLDSPPASIPAGPPSLTRQSSSLQARMGAMLFSHSSPSASTLQLSLLSMLGRELGTQIGRLTSAAGGEAGAKEEEYLFELASIIVSLSGTDVGRKAIGVPPFLRDVLALFPLATERVQRQVSIVLFFL